MRDPQDPVSTPLTRRLAAAFSAAALMVGFSLSPAPAAAVTLAWDPNTEPDLAGYRLYRGTASGFYSAPVDLGIATRYELSDLELGTTYYFALSALNASGLESAKSAEVVYRVPAADDVDETGGEATGGSPPVLVRPEAGAAAGLTPEIINPNAVNAPPGLPIAETRWQITRSGDGLCVLDVWSRFSMEGLQVPQGVLEPEEEYCARTQMADDFGRSTAWSPRTCFRTGGDAADADSDGVPDDLETTRSPGAGRSGTGGGEGPEAIKRLVIPGRSQALGIRATAGAAIARFSWTAQDSGSAELPYGLIRFKLLTPLPGDDVAVTVFLPDPAPPDAEWHGYDPVEGIWEDMSSIAAFSPDRRQVTLTLSDGGAGDADGVANGIVIDSSGLALPRASASPGGPAAGSGSGAGGCFIAAAAGGPAAEPDMKSEKPAAGTGCLFGGLFLALIVRKLRSIGLRPRPAFTSVCF